MSIRNYELLKSYFIENEIVYSDLQIQQFDTYYELLTEWNKVMNLTAITDFEDVLVKHFIDSLAICKYVDFNKYSNLIDVGTGAGFPGLPIKIMFPHLRVTLMDSLNKRINFLNEVITACGLQDIIAIHGRAEDFAHVKDYREQYDLCVSRAVANLSVLNEYCMPFVKIGGKFIPFKSEHVDEELNNALKSIKVLGGKFVDKINFDLYGTEAKRTILIIDKVKSTNPMYPRKAGVPTKNPIQ